MTNQMNYHKIDPDLLWEGLLSGDDDLIREIYVQLDVDERNAIVAHLEKVVNEEDWHPLQRESAQLALKTITAFETRKQV